MNRFGQTGNSTKSARGLVLTKTRRSFDVAYSFSFRTAPPCLTVFALTLSENTAVSTESLEIIQSEYERVIDKCKLFEKISFIVFQHKYVQYNLLMTRKMERQLLL